MSAFAEYDEAILEPQETPKVLPAWGLDRSTVHNLCIVRVESGTEDTFTFKIYDVSQEPPVLLDKEFTFPRSGKVGSVPTHFPTYPSTIETWFAQGMPGSRRCCALLIDRKYFDGELSLDASKYAIPEGKWPLSLPLEETLDNLIGDLTGAIREMITRKRGDSADLQTIQKIIAKYRR